jgi:hypothetical protein
MASVIDLHIPDPPPVQNKTFPLKISGLNTSIELAKGATTGLEVIVSSTMDIRISWLVLTGKRSSPDFRVDLPFT